MLIIFYIAAAIAVIATVLVITQHNLVHALLYLVVSFLAVAMAFYVLGAPFIAALEVIIYAGAIVVLMIFVIMMLNLRQESVAQEKKWLNAKIVVGPVILALVLAGELLYMLSMEAPVSLTGEVIGAKAVGMVLYGPYVIGVELSGILLMSGIVGAYHLGRQKKKSNTSVPRKTRRMTAIPAEYGLVLASVLFMLGLISLLIRRNIVFMLISVEIMLNAAGLAFIVAGSRWGQADGQVMFLFILTMAAAEVSVGLALILQIYHQIKTLNSDEASKMKG